MKLTFVISTVAWLTIVAQGAPAGQPMQQVKSTADEVIAILSNPALQGEAKTPERHRLIRNKLEERFDWVTICRSCLGHHWTKLSHDQQTAFIDLFKQFLERTYLERIEPYYSDLDHIEYQGERIVDTNFASVKTVVITKQKIDHPVEYRMERTPSGNWQVYDVIIEGVSLVKNYRTQFDDIIARSSLDGLISDLKAKAGAPQAAAPPPTAP